MAEHMEADSCFFKTRSNSRLGPFYFVIVTFMNNMMEPTRCFWHARNNYKQHLYGITMTKRLPVLSDECAVL